MRLPRSGFLKSTCNQFSACLTAACELERQWCMTRWYLAASWVELKTLSPLLWARWGTGVGHCKFFVRLFKLGSLSSGTKESHLANCQSAHRLPDLLCYCKWGEVFDVLSRFDLFVRCCHALHCSLEVVCNGFFFLSHAFRGRHHLPNGFSPCSAKTFWSNLSTYQPLNLS
jgi:hypothetical protein